MRAHQQQHFVRQTNYNKHQLEFNVEVQTWGLIKSLRLFSSQVKSSQIKSSQVKSSQVKSSQIYHLHHQVQPRSPFLHWHKSNNFHPKFHSRWRNNKPEKWNIFITIENFIKVVQMFPNLIKNRNIHRNYVNLNLSLFT